MTRLRIFSLALALGIGPGAVSADCAVTLPSSSPVEVPKWSARDTSTWYGSEALAVRLPADGRWKGMGPRKKFRDKFWVWRRGYDAHLEPRPALTVSGVKLNDGHEPQRLHIKGATNAFGPGWNRMLMGVDFRARVAGS
jgi:hypothetical protein